MADYREIHDSESEYSSDIAFSESEDEEIQTLPYQFEPIVRLDEGNSNNQADVIENEEPERSGNTNWYEIVKHFFFIVLFSGANSSFYTPNGNNIVKLFN
jgi:ABC-type uncharacterized transport system fused permease/ATPase subunit